MITDNWIKKWVKKKIKYYESFLKNNNGSPIRNEVEESIKILRELL